MMKESNFLYSAVFVSLGKIELMLNNAKTVKSLGIDGDIVFAKTQNDLIDNFKLLNKKMFDNSNKK